jgi:hypothetical protein
MVAMDKVMLRESGRAAVADARTGAGSSWLVRRDARVGYLLGALCLLICAIMLAPLVVSISASLKTTQEAAAIPPTYFTHHLDRKSVV